MDFKEFLDQYQKKEVYLYKNTVSPNPLVSVCVQTYQHENFIKDCLNSILSQRTNFNFEILLGEDCSQDKTREICIDYAEKYPETIKLFLHHPENKIDVLDTITGNFNGIYNLLSARGKYLAFCEGDDHWTDTLKLQKQVDFLEKNSEYGFSYHRFKIIDDNNRFTEDEKKQSQPECNISPTDLIHVNYHPLLLSICSRNIFQDIPMELSKVVNVDTFLISLLGSYGKAKFMPEVGPVHYRKHIGGVWSRSAREIKILLKIKTYQELANYYLKTKKPGVAFKFINRNIKLYHSLIYSSLTSFRWKNAIRYSRKYLSYKKTNFRKNFFTRPHPFKKVF